MTITKKISKYIFIRPRFYDVWFTSLCRKYKSSEMLKLSNTLLSIIQNFDYIHQITKQKCNKFCANRMQSEWKKRRSEIKRNKKKTKEKKKRVSPISGFVICSGCLSGSGERERDVHVNVRSFWTLCLWRSTERCFLGWAWHSLANNLAFWAGQCK